MALQATMTFLGLVGVATAAAALCALVLILRARGAPPAPASESRRGPFDTDASAPLPRAQRQDGAWPTSLGLGIDSEAPQAQIWYVLETVQAQIGRRFDQKAQTGCRCGLGVDSDSEDFHAQIWRQCDLELDALCESAVDDQSAKVLQDLEDEFGGGPVSTQARRQLASAEPRMDFEANVELHGDRASKGVRSHAVDAIDGALDCMCAAVLQAEDEYAACLEDEYVACLEDEFEACLEDEYAAGYCALDDVKGEYAQESEVMSRQAAEVQAMSGHSMNMDGTFDVAVEDYGAMESVDQPVHCASLIRVLACHIYLVGL